MSLRLKLTNVPQCHECTNCREIFKSPLHLKYHKIRVHNRRRPYVCRKCRKAFRRISELQEHSRSHHEDGAFICDVCDAEFSTRRLLQVHCGIHIHFAGDHECGYCSACFLHIYDARMHVLLVHDDPSVLPGERVRRPRRSIADQDEDVFCVKGGEGLKIKLRRKLSMDGTEEQHGHTEDLNPGSHASDSGKGNSDMDEEDLLRSNQLLRTPTFVPRQNEHSAPSTSQHKPLESSLLSRPKLEVSHTTFGSSKTQPRLDSSDFLIKTNFACGGGLAGKAATPPQNGSLNRSFTAGQTNGLFAQNNSSGLFGPPKGNLQASTLLTKPLFNTASSFGATPVFNAKPVFAGMPNGTFTSGLFKSPASMLTSSKFGASTEFGAPAFTPKSATGFGSNLMSGGFGSNLSSSSFGSKAPNHFGAAPTPGFSTSVPLSSSMLGSSSSMLSNTISKLSGGTSLVPGRNGTISTEAVFGSKERVKSMLRAKAKQQKKLKAFEQYADEADSNVPSNPFAAAMKRAKNPQRRRPSDFLSDYSSFDSEDESSEEQVSQSSEEQVSQSSSHEAEDVELEELSQPESVGQLELGSSAVAMTPMLPPPSPMTYASPASVPPAEGITPAYHPSPYHPSPRQTILSPPHTTPISPRKVNAKSPKGRSRGSTPGQTPLHDTSLSSPVAAEEEYLPVPRRSNRHASITSTGPEEGMTPRHPPPSPRMNGDIELSEGPEVSGHLDLDTPAMSISIPKSLLSSVSPPPPKPEPKPAKGKPGRKPKSARTPNHSSGKTPNRPSATPTYPPTPAHPSSFTPAHAPPTPVHPSRELASEPKSRNRVPTKEEMMKKRAMVVRPKIGPKSFLRRVNRLREDSDADEADMFYREELRSISSGRTDLHAPYQSRFRENQKYLCYLRQRALDLMITVFPDIRIGGNFCAATDDVEGLLDYVTIALQGKDNSARCMPSRPSKRTVAHVVLGAASKYTIRTLQRKIVRLIRLILPSVTLGNLEHQNISTLPQLIHRVIKENQCS